MNKNRLTIRKDAVTINTLTFGMINMKRKQAVEAFNNRKGQLRLNGINLLLREEETDRLKKFLAIR